MCSVYEKILEKPKNFLISWLDPVLTGRMSESPALHRHAMLGRLGQGIPESSPAGFLGLELRW